MGLKTRPFLMERKEKSEFSIISFVTMWGCLILAGRYAWFNLDFKSFMPLPTEALVQEVVIVTNDIGWEENLNSSTPIGVEVMPTSEQVSNTPTPEVINDIEYVSTPIGEIATLLPVNTPDMVGAGLGNIKAFAYSYYYPVLGPPNCFDANWIDGKCLDITGIGDPWTKWLDNFGAGCPVSDFQKGDRFEVLYPPEIQGIYTCVDVCQGCNRADTTTVWIDFLHSYRRLVWGFPVAVRIMP